MNRIRRMRKWIRLEICIVLTLTVAASVPDAAEFVYTGITDSSIYGRVSAVLEEAALKRRANSGDWTSIRRLAQCYASESGKCRFVRGDAESLLTPLADAGDLPSILLMASIVRPADPERANGLALRAADQGDVLAQSIWMKENGLDIQNPTAFMRGMYRMQAERPGWKSGFDHFLKILQTEASTGNVDAVAVLVSLDSLRQRPNHG